MPEQHFAEVFPYPARMKLVQLCLLEQDKAKRQAMLHELFDGYQATADAPGSFFVEDLMEMYPEAKVVLNVRKSAAAWKKSISQTLKISSTNQYFAMTYWVSTDYLLSQLWQAVQIWQHRKFGTDDYFTEELYCCHNQSVKKACKEHGKDLLEFEPSMGWKPLCDFLGKPVPNTPFPQINEEAFVKLVMWVLMARGLLVWVGVLGSPILCGWLAIKWEKWPLW